MERNDRSVTVPPSPHPACCDVCRRHAVQTQAAAPCYSPVNRISRDWPSSHREGSAERAIGRPCAARSCERNERRTYIRQASKLTAGRGDGWRSRAPQNERQEDEEDSPRRRSGVKTDGKNDARSSRGLHRVFRLSCKIRKAINNLLTGLCSAAELNVAPHGIRLCQREHLRRGGGADGFEHAFTNTKNKAIVNAASLLTHKAMDNRGSGSSFKECCESKAQSDDRRVKPTLVCRGKE
ncbi:hypothetical protein KUCAC02_037229, partial [Chaenocephalus aceratus]